MSWQENVTESFIRGIGKTSGTILVLGFITGLWYLTEKKIVYRQKKKTTTETQTPETSNPDIDDELLHQDEWRFKKMFEKFA
jgi:hypothetical protein